MYKEQTKSALQKVCRGKGRHQNSTNTIIEPHGRGVPSAILNGRSTSSAILDLINMYFVSSMTIVYSENDRKCKIEANNC